MKIINAGYKIFTPDLDDPEIVHQIYRKLEYIGRICYKSADHITDESAEKFVRTLIRNGHEAMLEHAGMTVIFTVDRGVSHELVRHRLASFAQESTRYCNYSKDKFGNEITVIEPVFFANGLSKEQKEYIMEYVERSEEFGWGGPTFRNQPEIQKIADQYHRWAESCKISENAYFDLLANIATPQEARSVLPNSLKTEVVMTANYREWRTILKLRAAGITGKPHPQMLEVMVPLLNELREKLPALFDDIQPIKLV